MCEGWVNKRKITAVHIPQCQISCASVEPLPKSRLTSISIINVICTTKEILVLRQQYKE